MEKLGDQHSLGGDVGRIGFMVVVGSTHVDIRLYILAGGGGGRNVKRMSIIHLYNLDSDK